MEQVANPNDVDITITHDVRNIYVDYEVVPCPIGKGGYSFVYRATRIATPGCTVAVKKTRIYTTNGHYEMKRSNLMNEIQILSGLNHPNIVKYLDCYQEHFMNTRNQLDSSSYYIVLELMEGGELFQKIAKRRTFSEYEARNYAIAILKTLKYCHDLNIVHR
jgi:serine/threonine protein kinase